MTEVVDMINQEVLTLTRIPVDAIDLKLNTYHTYWLEHWRKCRVLGRKSIELLPYAMWWLQQHRQRSELPNQTVVWNKSFTYRVHLGKPSLEWMVAVFSDRPGVKRQCLIPHLRANEPNELLVFERGPEWKNRAHN